MCSFRKKLFHEAIKPQSRVTFYFHLDENISLLHLKKKKKRKKENENFKINISNKTRDYEQESAIQV